MTMMRLSASSSSSLRFKVSYNKKKKKKMTKGGELTLKHTLQSSTQMKHFQAYLLTPFKLWRLKALQP
jgi:hypothetical protein